MAAIPQPSHATVHLVYELHAKRVAAQPARDYLGWSQIGDVCDRALWYSYRWAERRQFDGRIARLFDTGHREEARLLQELRDCGMQVWDRDPETGEQFEVSSVGGHLRGHSDAVVLGMPEAPKTPHLVDVKTIKAEHFNELLKKGMRAMFPRYWAQGHGYMGRMGLKRAAFIFNCKDDDRMHVERFDFDPAVLQKYEERAERIVRAHEPPLRIHEDPTWWECKLCDFYELCKGATLVPQVNCRTCTHSTPVLDGDAGEWKCIRFASTIPLQTQREGCSDHRFLPPLLQRLGEPVDARCDEEEESVTYQVADGKTFKNGGDGWSSAEIRACQDKRFLTAAADMPDVQQWRRELGATIVR